MPVASKAVIGGLATLAGTGAVALGFSLENKVNASGLIAVPAKYPFRHKGFVTAIDAASARRGYQVYREVCAACHSLKYVAFRHLVGFIHSEEEMKAIAAEVTVEDGPDDEGKMFTRPGKLLDCHVGPYPNKQAAMAANNGALPPDLTRIVKARRGRADYIFSLLLGYCDAPAGVEVQDGLYFNPYFPGGQLGMARVLYNELIEYSDGTPATASQMAKDVSTFLAWCSEPFINDRKRDGIKALICMFLIYVPVFYWKRHKLVSLYARHYTFIPKKQ